MKATARILAMFLSLCLFAGALAACSQGDPSSQTQSPGNTTSSNVTDSSSTPNVNEPIKFGFIAPLTGDNMIYGQSLLRGVELVISKTNEAGGIDGRQITLEVCDDKNDPKETVNLANMLIDDPDIWCVLGPVSSTCTLAITPIMQKAEILLYLLASSHPDATAAGEWIFRGNISELQASKQLAEFSVNYLGGKRVGLFYVNNDWGQSVVEQYNPNIELLGSEIVLMETYLEGVTKDFSPMLTKFKGADLDLLYVAAWNYGDGAAIIQQLRSLELDCKVLVASSNIRKQFIEIVGDEAEGIYAMSGFYIDNPRPQFRQFYDEFQAAYAKDDAVPDIYTQHAYDCMSVLVAAMNAVGPDKTAVRDWMANMKDFEGLSGKFSFDETRSPTKPYLPLIYHDRAFVLVEDYNP